jgi:hypothetical protein
MKRFTKPSFLFSSFTLACAALPLLGCAPDVDDEPLADQELLIADAPLVEMLPSVVGGAAYALTMTNTAARPVTCRSAGFRAPIQRLDHCGEGPLSNELIDLSPLNFGASEVKRWAATADANAGGLLGAAHLAAVAAERQRQGFGDELLEYCPAASGDRLLDCGYDCTAEGHHYGDDWQVTNGEGGWKKLRCDANGTANNYETRCAGDVAVGSSVRQPGGTGYTIIATCQADGTFLRTAECSAGYQQSPDRLSCSEAWCGATPPGGDMFVANVDHGKLFATCRYGQGDPNSTHAVCDVDWVPNALNNGCQPRPMRDCGPGRPHGWYENKRVCSGGYQALQTTTCTDGRLGIHTRVDFPQKRCSQISDNRL